MSRSYASCEPHSSTTQGKDVLNQALTATNQTDSSLSQSVETHLPTPDEISLPDNLPDTLRNRLYAVTLHLASDIPLPGAALLVKARFSRTLASISDDTLVDELCRAIELLAWVIESADPGAVEGELDEPGDPIGGQYGEVPAGD